MAEEMQPISRRRLLKRLGAGTAVVWTAPVLSSMRSPAYAQSPTCFPAFCGPRFEFCGPESTCPLPPGCNAGICSIMNDGSCLCWSFAFCTCPNPVCQSDADCAPGQKCGPTEPDCEACCGRTACYNPCGLSGSAPSGRGIRVVRASDVRS